MKKPSTTSSRWSLASATALIVVGSCVLHAADTTAQIRVNQAGYLADNSKQALLMTAVPAAGVTFQVVAANGTVVSG